MFHALDKLLDYWIPDPAQVVVEVALILQLVNPLAGAAGPRLDEQREGPPSGGLQLRRRERLGRVDAVLAKVLVRPDLVATGTDDFGLGDQCRAAKPADLFPVLADDRQVGIGSRDQQAGLSRADRLQHGRHVAGIADPRHHQRVIHTGEGRCREVAVEPDQAQLRLEPASSGPEGL